MGNQMLKTLSFIGFSFSLIKSLKIGIIRQPLFMAGIYFFVDLAVGVGSSSIIFSISNFFT